MTTLLWFAELLLNTPMGSETTNELFEKISDQMEGVHYKKWEQIEKL